MNKNIRNIIAAFGTAGLALCAAPSIARADSITIADIPTDVSGASYSCKTANGSGYVLSPFFGTPLLLLKDAAGKTVYADNISNVVFFPKAAREFCDGKFLPQTQVNYESTSSDMLTHYLCVGKDGRTGTADMGWTNSTVALSDGTRETGLSYFANRAKANAFCLGN